MHGGAQQWRPVRVSDGLGRTGTCRRSTSARRSSKATTRPLGPTVCDADAVPPSFGRIREHGLGELAGLIDQPDNAEIDAHAVVESSDRARQVNKGRRNISQ
jgi:hypothetical protein